MYEAPGELHPLQQSVCLFLSSSFFSVFSVKHRKVETIELTWFFFPCFFYSFLFPSVFFPRMFSSTSECKQVERILNVKGWNSYIRSELGSVHWHIDGSWQPVGALSHWRCWFLMCCFKKRSRTYASKKLHSLSLLYSHGSIQSF